jgi:hypothetical protein
MKMWGFSKPAGLDLGEGADFEALHFLLVLNPSADGHKASIKH